LQANNPAPAIVIDGNWDVLAANGAASALFALLRAAAVAGGGVEHAGHAVCARGLGEFLLNAEEIRAVGWHRARQESLGNPVLAERLAQLALPSGMSLRRAYCHRCC
jgi:PAS domain-containing protein